MFCRRIMTLSVSLIALLITIALLSACSDESESTKVGNEDDVITQNGLTLKPLSSIPEGGAIAAFSIKGKGYVVMDNGNFYEYNPTAKSWSKKTSFPGESRTKPYGFSMGDMGYFGFGFNHIDVWAYNPDDNSWAELNILKTLNIAGVYKPYATLMVINNIVYAGNGALNKMYAGTIVGNESISWEEDSTFPGALSTAMFFSVEGKGFWGGGYLGSNVNSTEWFEYIPGTSEWDPLNDLPEDLDRGFNNGKIILIGSNVYAQDMDKIWTYHVSNDSWNFSLFDNFPDAEINFSVGDAAYIIGNDGTCYQFKKAD